jgi:poly(A) polymerase
MAGVSVLPQADWRARPGLARLVTALTENGGAARFVGGAVRDTLLGLPVADFDLATPLLPDAVIARIERAGIKAVPTGISHGTVTAVSDGHPYEITTLRRDVATDGRHATVAYSDDWQDDAARRDFTINALCADPATGEVFDWFGGLDDLAAGRVRFIGDAATRIAEDHLRILRFYRFAARFGQGALDAASHSAVIAARHSLRTLSRERVADELLKLLALAVPQAMIQQMARDAVLAEVLPEADGDASARLAHLLGNEAAVGIAPDAVLRLAALLPSPVAAGGAAARLRLSNRMRERLVVLTGQRSAGLAQPVRQLAYRVGTDSARDCWLLGGAPGSVAAALAALEDWEVPQFPVKGGALVARGVVVGPAVARLLRQIEIDWITADFPHGPALIALVDQALAAEARQ